MDVKTTIRNVICETAAQMCKNIVKDLRIEITTVN